jgi:predicted dehydrogenase
MGVGLTGTGWVGAVHARALRRVPGARLRAVVSRDRDRGEAFAREHGIERVYTDHRALLDDRDVEAVCVGLPNHLHAPVVLDAALAGKHVICEKPIATNLEEAEHMVAACRDAKVMLAVAVELCFVPKFVRAKELVEAGALGRVYQVHQREQHAGPHSPWFYTREEAGGGILMDMGCHSIEVSRWLLGRPAVRAVYALMSNQIHPASPLEDHATLLVEMEGGATALLEPSWALKGGMESHLNILGTEGVLYADLLRGTGMRMFSERGVADAPLETIHWSTPDADWLWGNGYPQEMEHFLRCARSGERPRVSGEDGLVQMEVSYAAYHSAATRTRVELPFRPKGVERAVDLWLSPGRAIVDP